MTNETGLSKKQCSLQNGMAQQSGIDQRNWI